MVDHDHKPFYYWRLKLAKYTKPQLLLSMMMQCKPELVAVKNKLGYLVEPNQDKAIYPKADLTKQGFYFLTNAKSEVVARFYIGRQRSKCGFEAVIRHVRDKRSAVCKNLMDAFENHNVYYIPSERMKPLTTGVNKGTVGLLMTRSHNDRFQNLEEMNRILNDNFKFLFQRF